jgi:hypothetical protein
MNTSKPAVEVQTIAFRHVHPAAARASTRTAELSTVHTLAARAQQTAEGAPSLAMLQPRQPAVHVTAMRAGHPPPTAPVTLREVATTAQKNGA